MRKSLFAGLAGLCLMSINPAIAATFTVGNAADIPDAIPGDGKCSFIPLPPNPNDPGLCTLRAAIMEANATAAHDTIVLQDGITYLLTIPGRDEDLAATGDLDIRQPVTISTPLFFGIPTGTATIDGNSIDRVFDVRNVAGAGVFLSGLVVKGGDYGGDSSKPGGGINVRASAAKISFVEISALQGYGLNIDFSPSAEVSYTTISGAPDQVALYIYQSEVMVEGSSLINSALGIRARGSDTDVVIISSTISGNTSGGVWSDSGSSTTLIGSTVANNSTWGFIVQDGTIGTARNTLFAGNTWGSCRIEGDGAVITKGNLYDDDTCPSGGANDGSLSDTPAFLSLLGDHGGLTPTHRPMTNSPALDRTTGPICDDYDYDQRAMPRAVGFLGDAAKCDIGSVELETDVIFFDQVDRL